MAMGWDEEHSELERLLLVALVPLKPRFDLGLLQPAAIACLNATKIRIS